MKRTLILLVVLVFPPMGIAWAQHDHMSMEGTDSKPVNNEGIGVVENVDQGKGVVTISHEPIASLNWPAMTMDFTVEDKKIYARLISGKKIRFQFTKRLGRYVVTDAKFENK